jgi:ribosomal protein S13
VGVERTIDIEIGMEIDIEMEMEMEIEVEIEKESKWRVYRVDENGTYAKLRGIRTRRIFETVILVLSLTSTVHRLKDLK